MHRFRQIGYWLCTILLFSPSLAYGWGGEGHRVVARIAASELSPAARDAVENLLGPGEAEGLMADASVWADTIKRQRQDTRPWHYVDIEIGSSGYDRRRDCPGDACVVEQIHREIRILHDRDLAKPVRAEALRFLIHFMGDLHQPLHCANNHDRGGNDIRVLLKRHQTNLHAIWDRDVVQALGRNPAQVAAVFEHDLVRQNISLWQRGSVVDWANETFQLAQNKIYSRFGDHGFHQGLVVLSPDYPRDQRSLVVLQLQKAGVRLAVALNTAFAASGQTVR